LFSHAKVICFHKTALEFDIAKNFTFTDRAVKKTGAFREGVGQRSAAASRGRVE
jgi:hypothetical protein